MDVEAVIAISSIPDIGNQAVQRRMVSKTIELRTPITKNASYAIGDKLEIMIASVAEIFIKSGE